MTIDQRDILSVSILTDCNLSRARVGTHIVDTKSINVPAWVQSAVREHAAVVVTYPTRADVYTVNGNNDLVRRPYAR